MQHRIILSVLAVLMLCGFGTPPLNLGISQDNVDCTVVAQDAWNFNKEDHIIIVESKRYLNHGDSFSPTFYCGPTQFGIFCPLFLPSGGIFGTGAVDMDHYHSGSFEVTMGLRSDYRSASQNYRTDNKLTIAFHIKGMFTNGDPFGGPLGWLRAEVVWKEGEFYTGGDDFAAGAHSDRICLNLDPGGNKPIEDGGGPTGDKSQYCGSDVVEDNTGVFSTGEDSLVYQEWSHVAVVWDGAESGQYLNGETRYYLDGVLVKTETGINGRILNSQNKWLIAGFAPSGFEAVHYVLDNLQIDNIAWDQDRVDLAWNCNVPDVF